MRLKCPICATETTDAVLGEIVCTECGTVLEQCVLDTESAEYHDSRPVGQVVNQRQSKDVYGQSIARKQLLPLLNSVLERVGLGDDVSLRIMAMHRAAIDAVALWSHGDRSRCLLAACVYVVTRERNIPVTMVDLAEWMHCPFYSISWYTSKLYLVLNLPPPPSSKQRVLTYIDLILGRSIFDVAMLSNIVKMAKKLVPFLEQHNLIAGRYPMIVAALCVTLAIRYEYSRRSLKKQMKTIILTVASSAAVSVDQLKLRLSEAVEVLMTSAQRRLPWLKVNIRSIHFHMNEILDASMMESPLTVVDPPLPLCPRKNPVTSEELENRRLQLMGISEETIKHEKHSENLLSHIEYAGICNGFTENDL